MTRAGVVIPAYEGAGTLSRSMGSLARQRYDGELQVVVAVNDGRADTFAVARRWAGVLSGPRATCDVLRTAAGRANAINAAESLLAPGPRLYLDQDAVLSPDALAALTARLAPGSGGHFAAPRPLVAPGAGRVSRAYYGVWAELPYVRFSPVTMGAYAVSAAGRERWGEFPALRSDDKFARLHFASEERAVVDATYEVIVPRGARALVHARRGYARGNRELAEAARNGSNGGAPRDFARRRGVVRCLSRPPSRWPASAVFLGVHAAAAVAELGPSGGRRVHGG